MMVILKKQCEQNAKLLNNLDLLDSWFIRSSAKTSKNGLMPPIRIKSLPLGEGKTSLTRHCIISVRYSPLRICQLNPRTMAKVKTITDLSITCGADES